MDESTTTSHTRSTRMHIKWKEEANDSRGEETEHFF